MNNYRFSLLALLFFSLILSVSGQDSICPVSISTFDIMPQLNPWLLTSNPAGLSFNPDFSPGNMELTYHSKIGDYKRVQEGSQTKDFGFHTERYLNVKNTKMYGEFSYNKSYEYNANYNLVNDPYRGTPYLLIDIAGNNDIIDREFFFLRGDISTPLGKHLKWGLSTNMNVGLGAQDRDPRSENKVMDFTAGPGMIVSFDKLKFGLDFFYSYYNEDIEVDIIHENIQLPFFQLHGLGTQVYHVAASYYRLYQRHTAGGDFQLQAGTSDINILLTGGYRWFEETADDGRKGCDASWSYLKNDSYLSGTIININALLHLKTGDVIHQAYFKSETSPVIGAEIIQRLEQVGEVGAVDWVDYGTEEKYSLYSRSMGVDYTLLKMKGSTRKDFSITLGLNQNERKQAYYLPNLTENWKNFIFSAELDKSFFIGKQEISAGAGIQRKINLNGDYYYDDENFLTTILLIPDFNYYTSNYTAPWLKLACKIKINRLFDAVYIRSNATFYKSDEELKRTVFNVSTGAIF